MSDDCVRVSRKWVNQHAYWVRAEWPNGKAVEWDPPGAVMDDGTPFAELIAAEAERDGYRVHDPEALLGGGA